jgi:hypothetical protein
MLLSTSTSMGEAAAPRLMQLQQLRRLDIEDFPSVFVARVKEQVGGVSKGDAVVLKVAKQSALASEVPTAWPDVLKKLKPDWRGAYEARHCINVAPAHALAILAANIQDTDAGSPHAAAAPAAGKAVLQVVCGLRHVGMCNLGRMKLLALTLITIIGCQLHVTACPCSPAQLSSLYTEGPATKGLCDLQPSSLYVYVYATRHTIPCIVTKPYLPKLTYLLPPLFLVCPCSYADVAEAPQQRILMVAVLVLPKAVCSLHDVMVTLKRGQSINPWVVLIAGYDLLLGAAHLNKQGIIHRCV